MSCDSSHTLCVSCASRRLFRALCVWKTNCLTLQPLLPKLNPTNYMPRMNMRVVLVLLLGFVFLSGQFHFCSDRASEPYATHVCPFCATAGAAILTSAPSMAIIPVLDRLESPAVAFEISPDTPRTTSPRAPPSF